MNRSAIDQAIEALETKKADQDRVLDAAIEALLELRKADKTPATREPRQPRKKRGLPATETV